MSGSYPTTPAFRSVAFRSEHTALVDVSQSGKRTARDFGGHRWRFGVDHLRLTADNFWPLYAFLLKQRGRFESFQIVLPDKATPRGAASSGGVAPLVNGASQTARTLNIDGLPLNIAALLKAGDLFKLAGHSKVYQLTADASSGALGAAVLTFEPALRQSPADNEALTIYSVPFTVMLSDPELSYETTPPAFYALAFEVEEAL